MELKMNVAEAESRARKYIKKKYSNRKIKILIKETSRHDSWMGKYTSERR